MNTPDREQDIAIAKALGLTVVDWWYEKNYEDGRSLSLMDNGDGTPYLYEYQPSIAIVQTHKEPSTKTFRCKNVVDGHDVYEYKPIPHYETPEGSWLILDFIRENPKSEFVLEFVNALYYLLNFDPRCDGYYECMEEMFTKLTPQAIKDAAYEAAKECVE